MKVTILGSGTSSGVPRIDNDWGACDPGDPRNRRTRASILVQSDTTTILVDSGPDMRAQLLAADVSAIDAVIWTHDHADHCHGIDDLRQLFHIRGTPVPGYARAETLRLLEKRFAYVFQGRDGYPPTTDAQVLAEDMVIGDIRVRSVDMPHGNIFSTGMRFEQSVSSIGYATDFNVVTPDMLTLFEGVDIWIADALRKAPHPTHPHLAMTLEAAARIGAHRTVLTHMDQTMDYAALAAELPLGVEPGHDGLMIDLP
ncbi:phosphoribosyl 1,2-cyclic phosphate phosphodiesterase [Sphingomonas vulcanisoli]|uniref:Phosphoribosyl 1,2-cyclic phosphate phosphodiesterase n=1 Tax=Sphingomonas vulcanisoli TaxID=1658060 RepID=A0ABX0TN81_9SPHN|nr:MBL fold metallo-hydrolase [Sphingomonas vulcanisoli]NIJ06982.1 phosphoribosyl 1,2-cyclic phosphate phosphodiesterase [Sphingomonas vulcanisoli]